MTPIDPLSKVWQVHDAFNTIFDEHEPVKVIVAYYDRNPSGTAQLTYHYEKEAVPLRVCSDYSDLHEVGRLRRAIVDRRVVFLKEDQCLKHRFFTLYISEIQHKEFYEARNLRRISLKLSPQSDGTKLKSTLITITFKKKINFEFIAKDLSKQILIHTAFLTKGKENEENKKDVVISKTCVVL